MVLQKDSMATVRQTGAPSQEGRWYMMEILFSGMDPEGGGGEPPDMALGLIIYEAWEHLA